MKQSIYLRVPSDIADLIEMDPQAEVTLNLEEQNDQFLLRYSVRKPIFENTTESVDQQQFFLRKQTKQLAPIVTS